MKNIFKLGLGGLILSALGCANEYINPTTRTQPLIPETPASAPVEPKEQPKPQIQEKEATIEVPVGFTAENKMAFGYLCLKAQTGETPLDNFEQILLASKISKKPAEGKATLADLATAFEELKGEELKLSYTEIIYAEQSQKAAIEELVNKAVIDGTLQQRLEFIKDARCTDKADLVEAAKIKVEYKIQDKKAFDAYCKAVEEKEGQTLDEFGKVLLAHALDTDNDGIVTNKDIVQGYAASFAGEAQLIYAQPVFAAQGQQKTIAALVAKELAGKDGKGLDLTEKIALVKKLRGMVEASKAPYAVEPNAQELFTALCEKEGRKDNKAKDELAALLDADSSYKITAEECKKYSTDKGYDKK